MSFADNLSTSRGPSPARPLRSDAALECGYSGAGIAERIYARSGEQSMAAAAGLDEVHHPDMIAYIPGFAQPIYGREAHSKAMKDLVKSFPDIRVHTPYPIQFGAGDWITVVTNATGTFTGELALPDGTVVPPTGKSFDLEFGQTSKWQGDQLIVISAFWDSGLQARQLGMA